MKRNNNRFYANVTLIIVMLALLAAPTQAKQSILYGGGPLYSYAATHRDMIRASGFTTIVLWTIHVHEDGDLVLNDKKLVDDGVYVGRAEWPGEVAAFKTGNTSVKRIEIAIGSWGVPDFERIESFIDAEGTGPGSTLYQNFLALRNAVPAIDAVSYDDESNYDVDSTVTLSHMLNDLGYKISLCPYTYSSFWSSVYSTVDNQRPGIIDRVDLQCYAGGGGNNPGTWNNYFGGLKVSPGMWCYPTGNPPSQVQSQMTSWNNSYTIAGGFMWLLDDMLPHQGTYAVADYATAINNALSIDPSIDPVVTLYQHCPYGGWTADLGIGAHTTSDIVLAGGIDNDASSIQINPGYQVTFYDGDNFTGETLVKTANDTCLVDEGWNDRVSSIIVEINPSPVGYWQFNDPGDTTADDASDNGYDGTLTNMDISSWTLGKQCTGLAFDGVDDYVEIPGFKGITGQNSRTCTAWIKTSTTSGEILTWGQEYNGGRWIIRVNEGGQLRAEVQGGNIIGSTLINDGTWHHIAVVLENDNSPAIEEAKLYVDGQLEIISASVTEPINTGFAENVLIGTYFAANNPRWFNGLIDEVRIYGRAVNAGEIQDMYQQYALISDVEPDGDVDLNDFAAFANNWENSTGCDGDLTCDCIVDMDDLMFFIDEWLRSL